MNCYEMWNRISSNEASGILEMYAPDDLQEAIDTSGNGIYIGKSARQNIPVFIDQSATINPHIFIAGITGSGKSFALKNIITRMSAVLGYGAIIIDLTGEFSGIAENNGEVEVSSRTSYFGLFKINREEERMQRAEEILCKIIEQMRMLEPDSKIKSFVIFDEAWKILERNKQFETLIREGRKYGIGIIISSQSLLDLDREMLENIGSLLIFKLTDPISLSLLAGSYGLNEAQIDNVKNLEVGRCMLLRSYKSRRRSCVFISRFEPVNTKEIFKIILGDCMDIEIDEEKFLDFLKSLNITKERMAKINEVIENRPIGLDALISELILADVDRRKVLYGLRSLGMRDDDIADTFAIAAGRLL